ncbi:RNase H family protein, partial [Vibrio parahaemolyticus]
TGGVTSQRAELLALIIALLVAGEGDNVFSDSQYCVRGFNEWLDSWKRNAWRNSSKKPVANQDLWMLIDELKAIRPRVSVEHVAGHSGIKGNEHSDRLATQAAVDSKQTLS